MPLQSCLFRGDAKLEAAASTASAHIVPGATGEHVARIQHALCVLDRPRLEIDGIYGQITAAAVLAYKRKRNIINYAYETGADNVVGVLTIDSVDRELLAMEQGGSMIRDPKTLWRRPVRPFVIPG